MNTLNKNKLSFSVITCKEKKKQIKIFYFPSQENEVLKIGKLYDNKQNKIMKIDHSEIEYKIRPYC